MKSKIVKLTKKPFVRNVLTMATGTATAQAVTMALSPVITRLYGPEAFGIMGVFMSIVGIIAPIAALTYPIAIVLPKSDYDAKGLINLSLYISVGIATIAALILLFFNQPIVKFFQIGEVAPFLYLIPLVILFSGFLQVIEQWLIRTKQFGITAKVAVLQALILNGSKVGVGIFHPVASVLVILAALGNGLKALMMFLFSKRSSYNVPQDGLNPIIELAKKHRDFPLYRAPQVFINAISQNLPILLLASFFGPISAGFYSLGRSVLNIPTQLIGKSVGDVFYPRISEAANNGENLTHLIKKAIIGLVGLGIIPFGVVIIFGPWLFSFVFGAEWLIAGKYARWIALWLFFSFIYQPCIRAFPILSAQGFHLKFTAFSLLIQAVGLSIGYYVFSSDLMAIVFFGLLSSVLNIILVFITLNMSKNFDKNEIQN